ncbi:MAG: hypothetical protein R3F31_24515 [Verrucomicrobiales bacterium]|nr:hypothetical protein [Verrucomicrobiae bacterium]MCP5554153.1 hypothetical protein [Akkermansiaceae bacterium]HRX54796.1 hypothetical protein [Verrucomicrobiales bacterium]
MNTELLTHLLQAAAVGQALISLLNLAIPGVLRWGPDLERLPLLLREVFHVHKWFITITLVIFATLTWRFAGLMAGPHDAGEASLAGWLAAGIGGFWLIRGVMQWTYYSWSHWRGLPGRMVVHLILTVAYGGCAATYLVAAFRPL